MAKETETKENNGEKRSLYPYYSLERCLEVALAVHELGGSRKEIPKSSVADQMRVDANAAAFMQLLGSAKAFGLIEGRGSYSLTEVSKQHFNPIDDATDRAALLRAIRTPEVFEDLIDRFDGGKLPTGETVANILQREYDISASWAPRIASLFAGALKFSGALDSNGFVRYESTLHRIQEEANLIHALPGSKGRAKSSTTLRETEVAPPLPPSAPAEERPEANEKTNVWVYKVGGASLRLETPPDMPYALWLKLNQFVQVLKPLPGAGTDSTTPAPAPEEP